MAGPPSGLMGLTSDILATYRSPRTVMRRHLDRGTGEGRALMFLVLACALLYLAQWPRLRREALMDGSVPLDMRMGGALFGWMLVVPLAMYGVAFIARMAARVFGGRGTGKSARLALFWSLVATAPLWILGAMVSELLGPGSRAVLSTMAGAVLLVVWGLSMIEAEIRGVHG